MNETEARNLGAAGTSAGGNGTGGGGTGARKGKPTGVARGLAAGEFFKRRGPRKVDPAVLARRRGRLGKVPRKKESELGKYFAFVASEEMEWQGYTQCELAIAADVSPSEMSLLLNARHRILLDTAEHVADALGFEVEDLLQRARMWIEHWEREAVREAVHAALQYSIL